MTNNTNTNDTTNNTSTDTTFIELLNNLIMIMVYLYPECEDCARVAAYYVWDEHNRAYSDSNSVSLNNKLVVMFMQREREKGWNRDKTIVLRVAQNEAHKLFEHARGIYRELDPEWSSRQKRAQFKYIERGNI